MRTDACRLALLLWSFSSGWHSPWRVPLHRVSSPCHWSTGSLNILPVFWILEHHQIFSAFFGRSWNCQHCLAPVSCCMNQGTQKPREEHPCLITAKLLVCLQQPHGCKLPHTKHLSLASVVGNQQKHSKTSSHPNSALRWAATAALKLQAGMDRNEFWV